MHKLSLPIKDKPRSYEPFTPDPTPWNAAQSELAQAMAPLDLPEVKEVPDLVILDEPFGIVVNGCTRAWSRGHLFKDAATIKLLIQHNAPLEIYRRIDHE